MNRFNSVFFVFLTFYFDQFRIVGDETTSFLPSEFVLIIYESQLHGARVAKEIHPDVTHVVCVKPKSDDRKIERTN